MREEHEEGRGKSLRREGAEEHEEGWGGEEHEEGRAQG